MKDILYQQPFKKFSEAAYKVLLKQNSRTYPQSTREGVCANAGLAGMRPKNGLLIEMVVISK